MNMLASTTDLRPAAPVVVGRGYWQRVAGRLAADRLTLIAAAVLLLMLVLMLAAPWVASADPYASSMVDRLKPVFTPGHVLGTDELGRDMLSRLLYGGRLSWLLGILPILIACAIGMTIGILAGFAGGWLNMAVMRTTDVFYAFPSVLLAVAVSGALGPGIGNAILSLTLVFIPQIIRVSESVTTSVRNLDYVEAARASGASALTIVRVHILPNVVGPILSYATSLISLSMILASGLSFLGLGTRPPEPEWGLMLNTLRSAIYLNPVVPILPGLCIFISSLCFNILSDGFRTAMEIKD